jgi:hypothetical protein
MQCPTCAALNREHSQECETEASATLRQRSQSLSVPHAETSGEDPLGPVVLKSRKRQAHIAFKLHQQRAQDHRTEEKHRSATA